MAHNLKNFGIAAPKVKLLAGAPYINTNPMRMNFDVSAEMFPTLQNSPFIAPLLAECAVEADLGTFAVVYPSKRKTYINNFLEIEGKENTDLNKWKEANADEPYITWTPINFSSSLPIGNIVSNLLSKFNPTQFNADGKNTKGYTGPVWLDAVMPFPAPPNDLLTIKNFKEWLAQTPEVDKSPEQQAADAAEIKTVKAVEQAVSLDGLWWGVESSKFISPEMPFWINIKKRSSGPSSDNHPTAFIISFGLDTPSQRYDLLLSTDSKPQLFDYVTSTPDAAKAPYKVREWDIDLSRTLKEDGDLEIGIMTAGGRLIIHVNQIPLIYTRTEDGSGDDGGKIKVASISEGKVRIFGTNVMAVINACPMTYAPLSVLALPIPSTNQLSEDGSEITWAGVDAKGEPFNSVAELPKPPSVKDAIFGVDCYDFKGDGGVASPSGPGFHKHGTIEFRKAANIGYELLKNTSFFFLIMNPSQGVMINPDGTEKPMANLGCPYFFRLKGVAKVEPEDISPSSEDITDYLLTMSENANAPDYFHVKRSATLTFYNENNVVSSKLQTQKVIQIQWGWGAVDPAAEFEPTFTGIVTSINLSQTPGMETVTVNCEDYMYILNSTPIINSPFYDGMVAYYAIADLAKRGGCTSFIKSWADENDYFLPSGFAYTKPAVKFPSMNRIFECIIDMVKRFEAFFYFNGKGQFVIEKLPGGLFSKPDVITANFTQSPSSTSYSEIILGEVNVTVDWSSTVNQISILTLERDTRNAIVFSDAADNNLLLFKKAMFIDQPAYGELTVARKYARELGKRVYKPIRKVNVKTAGGKLIKPLDYVKVGGLAFRVTSFKRSYSAEANDFTQDVECEWLGG